jgi:hypothetical protein
MTARRAIGLTDEQRAQLGMQLPPRAAHARSPIEVILGVVR